MFKRLFTCFGLVAVLLMSKVASATTPVTGNIKNLGTGNVSSGSFVRFYLRGCAGNQPRANGVAIVPPVTIAPTLGNVYYFDFVADNNGNISGTLYSTRDSTGLGNGDIECGGSLTSVWYGMQPYLNGKAGPETPVHAVSGTTLNISTVVPITANPVVTAAVGLTTLTLPGSISGFTSLRASPVASGTLTLPAVPTTDTLVGQNTTDTLTNKTLIGALLNSGATFNGGMFSGTFGSAGAPAYTFVNNNTTGLYSPSLNQLTVAVGGVNGSTFSQNGMSFGTDTQFLNFGLNRDTSLSRVSAGVLAVGNGNQGDASGTLKANAIQQGSGAFLLLDANAVSHFFISNLAPFTNTFISGNGSGKVIFGNNLTTIPDSGNNLQFAAVAGSPDSSVSRSAAGTIAIGNGTQGDASGTLKDSITNAVTGFQINGAAPSGHFPRGNGTNYVDGQVASSDITPGANGQCLVTSGGGATWGSCAGTAGMQILQTDRIGRQVNANTTASQTLSSYSISANAFNSINRIFQLNSFGNAQAAAANTQVFFQMTFGGSTWGTTDPVVLPDTNQHPYTAQLTCYVLSTGSPVPINCQIEVKLWGLNSLPGTTTSRWIYVTEAPAGVDLTVNQTLTTSVSFGVASAGNICNQSSSWLAQFN